MRILNQSRRVALTVVVAVAGAIFLCGGPVIGADEKPKPAAPSQEKPATTAVEAAKDYTQRMKSAEPATAIRTYWDMDAMLAGIFGEHLRRHGDEERAEMQRLLLTFVENVYATPNISAAMKQATFEDFKEDIGPSAGTTAVGFNVRIQDKVIPNSLHLKQVDGKWKILDAGTNGRMMVAAIRSQYEPQAERVTPLDYIKAMVAQVPGAKAKENPGNPPAGPRQP